MHDDRLKALIEQADANPPACHTTPLELAGQVRVLYRRRQRQRASLLAAAAILVAAGLAFWMQIDRGASRLQLANVAIIAAIAPACEASGWFAAGRERPFA
jgi:hypothetical protein